MKKIFTHSEIRKPIIDLINKASKVKLDYLVIKNLQELHLLQNLIISNLPIPRENINFTLEGVTSECEIEKKIEQNINLLCNFKFEVMEIKLNSGVSLYDISFMNSLRILYNSKLLKNLESKMTEVVPSCDESFIDFKSISKQKDYFPEKCLILLNDGSIKKGYFAVIDNEIICMSNHKKINNEYIKGIKKIAESYMVNGIKNIIYY